MEPLLHPSFSDVTLIISDAAVIGASPLFRRWNNWPNVLIADEVGGGLASIVIEFYRV